MSEEIQQTPKCKEWVGKGPDGWHTHLCNNKAQMEGYCMVHHPHAKAYARVKELEKENAALKKKVDSLKEEVFVLENIANV